MKKRWIVFSIIGVFVIGLYVRYKVIEHCRYYSVYYAQHMTEQPDPDIVAKVFIWNLNYIERKDEGYRYDFDGSNYVEKYEGDIRKGFGSVYGGFSYTKGDDISWWFDYDMNATTLFLVGSDEDREMLEENQIDSKQVKQAKQEIYRLIQPVIDIQPEPDINIQWGFNYYYKKLDNFHKE